MRLDERFEIHDGRLFDSETCEKALEIVSTIAKRIREALSIMIQTLNSKIVIFISSFKSSLEILDEQVGLDRQLNVQDSRNWYPDGVHVRFMMKGRRLLDKRKALSSIVRYRNH